MLNSKLILGVVAVGCLLTGWFAGSGELSVEAQRDRTDTTGRRPTIPRVTPETPTTDCAFTVVDIAHHGDRGKILLDECTGDTWWYDNGWERTGDFEGDYLRSAVWRLISREGAE